MPTRPMPKGQHMSKNFKNWLYTIALNMHT